jgi:hypothetical protein
MSISERDWVSELKARLEPELARFSTDDETIRVSTEKYLYYAREMMAYGPMAPNPENNQYRVDLLIYGDCVYGKIPRVAIECKLETINPHDGIAYNEKARRHKGIYPYLRYGVVIAKWGARALPARLVRDGRDLEFAFLVHGMEISVEEWSDLVEILGQEIVASRQLHTFFAQNRKTNKSASYRYIHRPLKFG